MILEKPGLGYNDVSIVPTVITPIRHRCECLNWENLPIFTAPMSTVVNVENFGLWSDNGITPILPRNISYETRVKSTGKGAWIAYSLTEFEDLFVTKFDFKENARLNILIDIANGHMSYLYALIRHAKINAKKNGCTLKIMTGNIANPSTYEWLCYNSEVDYIRVGIGSGMGCITSSNTGIHYPMASLIDECNSIRQKCISLQVDAPQIVADGGIRNYSDVIKALALGANYVMIGGLFAGFFESAAPLIGVDEIKDWSEKEKLQLIKSNNLQKEFYGMASAKGQEVINGQKTKTAEGIVKLIPVQYTIAKWVENMEAYLKSAMSYCGCWDLHDFIGKQTLVQNSPAEIAAINK